MSKLGRYALFEFLKVLGITLLIATVLMIVWGVMKEALQQGLGFWQVVQLIPYIVPEALRFAVPGTTLFAACSVYGRLASGNEIIAVKSLGIHPMALLWPVLAASFVISLGTIWINDVAATWGRNGVRRVIVDSVEEIAYGMLRTQKSYRSNKFTINVKHVEDRTLYGPMITYTPGSGKSRMTMTAEYGRLITNPEENALTVQLHNGTVEFGDGAKAVFPDTIERVIPLPEASNSRTEATGPAQLPLAAIPGELVRQTQKIDGLEQELAARAAYQMLTGDFAAIGAAQWPADHVRLRDETFRLHRLRTEPHRRWANGLSCLCFVFVGAPLAIRLRNADFLTSFFLCFAPILIVYFPLLAYGVDRAKSGAIPPFSVWLGNVILVACGGWLLRKVIRY